MVPGKLPVPGRPTILITVGQGPCALAVGAGGGCLDIFILIYPFSPLSPSLWETARYRLKYCLKGPWGWSGGAMMLGKLPVPGRPTILITVGQGLIALAVGAGWGWFGHFYYHLSFLLLSLSLGWLVDCFGFNGPLRQYFSLYRAVSKREGEKGEKG